MTNTVITSDKLMRPNGPFSQAMFVPAGKQLLFISGMTPRNKAGEVVGINDMEAQTRQVCENLQAVVEAAGGSLTDIVRIDVFVTELEEASSVHTVRREFFGEHSPTSIMVQVAGFFSPEYLIEINAIAAL